jgi:hypothetical protein
LFTKVFEPPKAPKLFLFGALGGSKKRQTFGVLGGSKKTSRKGRDLY